MGDRVISHQIGVEPDSKIWNCTGRNMLIYVHSDGGSIVCHENIYPVEKGVLCFIGAKKYHYTMLENPDVYDRSVVFLPEDACEKVLSLLSPENRLAQMLHEESFVYAQIHKREQADVENLFQEIFRFDSSRYGDAVGLSCYLKLLVYLDKNMVENISVPHMPIYRAIAYINTHISTALNLGDICQIIHMSKYHFCRQFKKTTGITVMRYILETRLILAKSMLMHTDLSVGEISEKCGFGSISYFCRFFKQDTHLTPLQYRRDNRA